MSHSEEGVTEDTGGNSPVLGIDQQHALKQRHKLPPVCLLCLHVSVIRTQHQVHLTEQVTATNLGLNIYFVKVRPVLYCKEFYLCLVWFETDPSL